MPDPDDDVLRRPPIRRRGTSFEVRLGADETALVKRLLGELRDLLTADDPGPEAEALVARLFPVAHPDDEELEAEYQRLMRDELVQSKLAAFDVVDRILDDGRNLDEAQLTAFMQSVNSIRLVLGVMLNVTDDPDEAEVAERLETSPEYALYSYLSYLLELSVTAAG